MKTQTVDVYDYETKKKKFGYMEKYLCYDGRPIPFKAIFSPDEQDPVDIVSADYYFIPHEELEEELDRAGLEITQVLKSTRNRRAYFYIAATDEAGVIVTNSIDRSMAINVYAYVGSAILSGRRVVGKGAKKQYVFSPMSKFQRVYNLHTKGVDLVKLVKDIKELLIATKEFDYMWLGLAKIMSTNAIDFFDEAVKKIPKKYCADFVEEAKKGKLITLRDLYDAICVAIWSSKLDTKSKVVYMAEINDSTFGAWVVLEDGK